MEATKPKKKNSFKTSKHPDWGVKNIAFRCWFIPVPDVQYDESIPPWNRFVPQSVWDTGKSMQLLWNFLFRKFKKLRDNEPLKCQKDHDLKYDQVYTDPK